MKWSKGMTLIEIMIVLAMISVLALSVAPLASGWLRQSEVTAAVGNFHLAVGRAKAAALRNNMGATDNTASAVVCFSAGEFKVVEGKPGTAPACNSTEVAWRAKVASTITITNAGGAAMNLLCFDNKGLPTTVGCTGGATTNQFTIRAGADHEEPVSI